MFEIRYWMIDGETNQTKEVMQGEIDFENKYYNGITVGSPQSDEGVLIVNGRPGNAIQVIRASHLQLADPMSLISQVSMV